MDEIKMKEALDEEVKKYRYTPEYQVEVAGRKIDVPVKYADASAFMVLFPISMEKAKNLLKSPRLTPVSILKGRAVLAITFFDYRESPVGPYHEFTFSIPVLVDSKFNVPILPLILDSLFPSFGYHVVLLGTNTDISKQHIERIFPYPLFEKKVEVMLRGNDATLSARILSNNEEILSVRANLPQNYTLKKKRYNTYFSKNQKIYKVVLTALAWQGTASDSRMTRLSPCNHLVSNFLEGLDIDPISTAAMYYKNAYEVLDPPVEV